MRPSAFAAFLVGSFVAHGVAYAALATLPQDVASLALPSEVEIEVFEPPPEPEKVPVVAIPEPMVAPLTVVKRRALPVREAPPQEQVPPAEPPAEPSLASDAGPAPLLLGASSDTGLAVAGRVGIGTSNGSGVGNGTGAAPTPPAPKVDLGPIAKEWMQRVSMAINSRAQRDYPRSALRAHLEGSVLLAVQVDTAGRVSVVALKRSSGHAQLDEAALAAARALGALPAPPAALHAFLKAKPISVPINYRSQ